MTEGTNPVDSRTDREVLASKLQLLLDLSLIHI